MAVFTIAFNVMAIGLQITSIGAKMIFRLLWKQSDLIEKHLEVTKSISSVLKTNSVPKISLWEHILRRLF